MKKVTLTMAVAALLFAASCNSSNTDTATTNDAVEAQATAGGSELKADLTETKIEWEGSKAIGGKHTGTIALKDGVLNVENDAITGGNFVFDLNTLTPMDQDAEGNAKLKGHLLSPDFLDVEKFPDGSFQITSVSKDVDTSQITNKQATHMITGNLTLNGVTKSITFPAQVTVTADKVEAHAVFNIDRTQWNINFNSDASIKDKFINKEIDLTLHLVAKK